jgi:hypothetical protein
MIILGFYLLNDNYEQASANRQMPVCTSKHLFPLVVKSLLKNTTLVIDELDAKFDKQYLEGKYGADPYLRKIIDWGRSMAKKTEMDNLEKSLYETGYAKLMSEGI